MIGCARAPQEFHFRFDLVTRASYGFTLRGPPMPATVHPPLFVSNPEGTPALEGAQCGACGAVHFPAHESCPYCAAAGCERMALSTFGRLELVTTVGQRPPGYSGPLPYGFGVVELPEGVRVISRIRASQGVAPGAALRLVLDDVAPPGNEPLLAYAFEPGGDVPDATLTRSTALLPAPPLRSRSTGRAVYIAGVGLHPFGRFEDRSLVDLGVVAAREALAQAQVGRGLLDAVYGATVYGGVAAGHRVMTALGHTGMPIMNIEAGCASGGAALAAAAAAIAAGQYDTVLVVGVEKMPRGIIRSSFFEAWREQAGLAVTPAYFALRAQRLMRDSGVTSEHLVQVSVKNHRNGEHNPFAMYRKPLSPAAIRESPLVCDPLRLLMMCSPNEGAAAVVLSAAPSRVRVRAAVLRSHLSGNVLGEHTPLSGGVGADPPSATELAVRDAYEMAGVGPGDVDVAEVQDTDSARELLSYEELGLCEKGGSAAWFEAGYSQLGGRQPVNPSGGLLAKGEPLGASALAQVIELYWQLGGTAGARQVDGARIGLAHTVGRGANAAVVILGRDDSTSTGLSSAGRAESRSGLR